MDGKTNSFDVGVVRKKMVTQTLNEVYNSLKERGYNPTSQIVGYLISGDPGYISSYKECRDKILEFDRADIVAILVKDYIKNNK